MKTRAGKVLFVSSLLRYGGGERWMCDCASGLAGRGHGVVLVARPGSALAAKAEHRGIQVCRVEMRGDFDPAAIGGVYRIIRRFRPDVICPNLDREIRISATALGLARSFPGSGVRGARLIPRRGSEFPLKNKRHYRYFYTRFVDKVIANSLATLNTMRSRTPWFPEGKAVLIYNGIDVGVHDKLMTRRRELRAGLRALLKIQGDAPLVVLVGELNERKGHRSIIDAAETVIASFPKVHFLFVGEGDDRPQLERLIAERGLTAAFSLLGFRDDVDEILAASDMLVLPSRVEGFGYVLAEAMAASLPVVASRASSIVEIVEDGVNGLLHEVGDSRAIAAHINTLLGDPASAGEMGARGRTLVRAKFNVERMLDDVERLFFGAGHTLSGGATRAATREKV